MPRTLPAALTTVMDTGIYLPYLRVVTNDFMSATDPVTIQPVSFELTATTAKVKFPFSEYNADKCNYFRLVRGAMIDGTPSTISSIWFEIVGITTDGKFTTLEGEILQPTYVTTAANLTYQDVIESVCDSTGNYPNADQFTYYDDRPWDYQFYPTGKIPTFNKASKLWTVLRQKYFVFVTENGWDGTENEAGELHFFRAIEDTFVSSVTDHTIEDILANFDGFILTRKLIWRDETSSINSLGPATLPIHNLGYLETTADHPFNPNVTIPTSPTNKNFTTRLRVHLKYRTGDMFQITGRGGSSRTKCHVKEVFDPEAEPSWYVEIKTIQYFSETEGGALPSTIEAAAPYTPLVTGTFDGILDNSDNNIQAAMETIDDHEHADNPTTEEVQDIVGAMLSDNTETGITATYQDSDGTIDLELTAAAETNVNDIFRCDAPGGVSAFAGTIATLPGGAVLTYNVTSGNEGAMVPTSTTHLAKMRLYNTTRGTSALISNCVVGTNTITLTANVPSGWAVTDVITIASQTVSGGGFSWADLEITADLTGKTMLFMDTYLRSGAAMDSFFIHPFETYGGTKLTQNPAQVTAITNIVPKTVKITGNVFTIAWNAAITFVVVREQGHIK